MSRDNALLFFRTPLPSAFVKALFEEDILLSEAEKDALVASDVFERLVSSLPSIKSMGIDPVILSPTVLFRLTIPETFDRVECEGFFDYEGCLVSSNDSRPYLRLADGRWVARNDELEGTQIRRMDVQAFLESFDDVKENTTLIKYSDDVID